MLKVCLHVAYLTPCCYRRQRSCDGYVFTDVCVHRGGGIPACLCRWYPSMPCNRSPGGSGPGGVPARGVVCSQGICSWGETPPPKADGYCCGRYASYWNAFLLLIVILCVDRLLIFPLSVTTEYFSAKASYSPSSISAKVRSSSKMYTVYPDISHRSAKFLLL